MKAIKMEAPDLERGDRVMVTEENITPWYGTVVSIKPTKSYGWWVEVDRDDVNGIWAICLANGTRVEAVPDTA